MSNEIIIKIKYKNGDMNNITQLEQGDWIDLHTSEEVFIKAGEYFQIPLGVCMELPKGYEAIVAPRSSTFKKYGLLQCNSIGIIDESYCGDCDEWKMPVFATRDVVLLPNTRIAQFRVIEHQPKIKFNIVEKLGNQSRDGFGSTGI